MKKLIFISLLFAVNAYSQTSFHVKNASKFFDVKIEVANCENGMCGGASTFSFYKKGGAKPYQIIKMEDTQFFLEEGGGPEVNVNLLYDKQGALNVDDFNFDGMEDVAICNGANGSYGGPSYSVYLSSRAAGKFVYNKAFSDLGQHLGMFKIDRKRKVLSTFDKSGCCWHIYEEYDVVNNRPRKIFEEVEDATQDVGDGRVKITTKKLAAGKWKTSVRYIKRQG